MKEYSFIRRFLVFLGSLQMTMATLIYSSIGMLLEIILYKKNLDELIFEMAQILENELEVRTT